MNKLLLLGETKGKIVNLLLEKRRTATEVADVLDIQVSAARKHLESMQDTGLVRHEYSNEGVGRPKKFFVLAESGRELLPNQYSDVLSLLLSKMLHAKDTWNVESLVERVAEDIATQIRDFKGDGVGVDAISTALNKFGFETCIEEGSKIGDNASISIVSRNCPMLKVASKHQGLICNNLHGHILKSALQTKEVELKSCMVMGDSHCRHQVVIRNHQSPV